ncbi:MAG: hypothetical protein P8O16_10965 [Algoriphagus sp.]|uniref:DUF6503 family protein n=1 Tax=Algoriphagus sp. TaxID=1872435 RepID=UPI00262C89CC|nr:DUF6503 family protein [Algoriphagus sp.]MDG1277794.1 hypothetical protein [Algoriphagus sp.]
MKTVLRSFTLAFLLLIQFACAEKENVSVSESKKELNPDFKKVLEAHGDWQKWMDAKAMSYAMVHETNLTQESHFINLNSRKTRISTQFFDLGFDGEKTWISPSRDAYSGKSLKFYHNLYFYFYSIPFVFTDPGVTVEKVSDKSLNGQFYTTLRASFDNNVGDSPDDEYFMLINPETNRLEYLLYTVTYYGESNPSLNALKYEDYRDNNGIYFPRILTGYKFENDSTKELRYNLSFGDLLLLPDEFDASIFEKPKTGVYSD